ncbi:hypothetical protein QFC24_000541 [Naganishia onofrii]|uniref:Uncharacterized protein n=1 Tax=Naganishia onofrii TaxID=1851511 RepID=A0ACC2XWG6_9TREE|nr:hypothetical protein QFC24_000541 [Naganishia onofrii]
MRMFKERLREHIPICKHTQERADNKRRAEKLQQGIDLERTRKLRQKLKRERVAEQGQSRPQQFTSESNVDSTEDSNDDASGFEDDEAHEAGGSAGSVAHRSDASDSSGEELSPLSERSRAPPTATRTRPLKRSAPEGNPPSDLGPSKKPRLSNPSPSIPVSLATPGSGAGPYGQTRAFASRGRGRKRIATGRDSGRQVSHSNADASGS